MPECIVCGIESNQMYRCKKCGENFCEECGDIEKELCLFCLDDEQESRDDSD